MFLSSLNAFVGNYELRTVLAVLYVFVCVTVTVMCANRYAQYAGAYHNHTVAEQLFCGVALCAYAL